MINMFQVLGVDTRRITTETYEEALRKDEQCVVAVQRMCMWLPLGDATAADGIELLPRRGP